MPSWQVRLFNTFSMLMLKPMARYGSISTLRFVTGLADRELPPGGVQIGALHCRPVSGQGYRGELLVAPESRRRKLLLAFPGGGFVLRSAAIQRQYIANLCEVADTDALIVHYRLAPETPFPGGLEDCIAAYRALLDEGRRPEDITLIGDSAGGGLVLSTLLALRDERSFLPGGAIVVSPLADLTFSGESRRTNRFRDPMLPTSRSNHMHELYVGSADCTDRFLSPVFADFDGLPPMMGVVGSTEILLDDTLRAARQAHSAGVPFFLDVWNRMPHCFPTVPMFPESRVALERMATFIRTGKVEPLPRPFRAEPQPCLSKDVEHSFASKCSG